LSQILLHISLCLEAYYTTWCNKYIKSIQIVPMTIHNVTILQIQSIKLSLVVNMNKQYRLLYFCKTTCDRVLKYAKDLCTVLHSKSLLYSNIQLTQLDRIWFYTLASAVKDLNSLHVKLKKILSKLLGIHNKATYMVDFQTSLLVSFQRGIC